MTEFDVAVLGSGAAGLTAAVEAADGGVRVGVFEKGNLIGGTTALSFGTHWLPGNRFQGESGISDSPERGFEYLMSLSNGLLDPEMVRIQLAHSDELVDFLTNKAGLNLSILAGYPDYHPENPGGMPEGGRAVDVGLTRMAEIGEWADRLVGVPRRMIGREAPTGGGSGFVDPDVLAAREREGQEGLGRSLIAGLLRAALARDVAVRTEARGVRLVHEDGAVRGIELETPGGRETVSAKAVILATGGFEYDDQLVRAFLRGPITRTIGVATNTGDGLRMAMRVGAALGNMREAWWSPVVGYPGDRSDGGPHGLLAVRERALPGVIMVNSTGHRFCNEASNYNALGGAFHQFDLSTLRYVNLPAYLVFDQSAVDRFSVFGQVPGATPPAWVARGNTIEELAMALAIPVQGLRRTVDRFNENARDATDPDFGRGNSAYDRWFGDHYQPNDARRTLAPVISGPFYGAEVSASLLGTKGGPATDGDGRVIDVDGKAIPGLYAAGNAMASPSGMIYGGAGSTLAIAGVWGMLSGRAAARYAHA